MYQLRYNTIDNAIMASELLEPQRCTQYYCNFGKSVQIQWIENHSNFQKSKGQFSYIQSLYIILIITKSDTE